MRISSHVVRPEVLQWKHFHLTDFRMIVLTNCMRREETCVLACYVRLPSMQWSTSRQLRQCAFNSTLHNDFRQSERGKAMALSRAPVATSNLLVMHRRVHSSTPVRTGVTVCEIDIFDEGSGKGEKWKRRLETGLRKA